MSVGIGANTAVYSLLDAVVLRPLPVRDPGSLVTIHTTTRSDSYQASNYADLIDYKGLSSDVFSGLAVYADWRVSLLHGGESELLPAELVSGDYFTVLGVEPVLGRWFSPPTSRDVAEVIISYGLWKRVFAGSARALGEPIWLTGINFTIVGVAPSGFRGLDLSTSPDFWVPLSHFNSLATGLWRVFDATDYEAQRKSETRVSFWKAVGRLRPGVTPLRAQSVLRNAAQDLSAAHPETHRGQSVTLTPATSTATPVSGRRDTLGFVILLTSVLGLTLLIACANVANLLLARAYDRRREVGIRIAVGATRGQLLRQLLTESLVLSLISGAAGLLLAAWAIDLFSAFRLPGDISVASLGLSLDRRALLYTAAVSLGTSLVFGLAPAARSSRVSSLAVLRDSRNASTKLFSRYRQLLVSAQVALSVVVLTGAGLFGRSLWFATRPNPDLDAEHLLAVTIEPALHRYDSEETRTFVEVMLDVLRAREDVEHAGLISAPGGAAEIVAPQTRARVGAGRGVHVYWVDRGYFETVGIRMKRGRFFPGSSPLSSVAVVSESAAQALWPDQEGLGRTLQPSWSVGGDGSIEVVGIVDNEKLGSLASSTRAVYLSITQEWSHAANREITFVLRTVPRAQSLVPAVRSIVRRLDPTMPIARIGSYHDQSMDRVVPQRVMTALLGLFATLGLLLAALGVYAVVAYSVAQRAREIGVRVALGADVVGLVRSVVSEGLKPVVAGIVGGVLLSAGLVRLGTHYYAMGITGLDPLPYIGACAVLLAIGLLASLLPARHAATVDPVNALRGD